MLCTEYLLIPSPPVQMAHELLLRMSKMVRFPRQVAECPTKLLENVLLEHIPFLYPFIAFLVNAVPWW